MSSPPVLRARAGSVSAASSATGLSASSLAPPPSSTVNVLNSGPASSVAAQPTLVHSDSDTDSDNSESTALNPRATAAAQPSRASTVSYGSSTRSGVSSAVLPPYPDSAYPPEFNPNPKPLSGNLLGDPTDAAMDQQNVRAGRMSAGWNEKGWEMVTSPDMSKFLGELFDLTHAIDAAENDIDEIVALRNRIVKLKPHLDVADLKQPDVEPDLHALAALTTKLGRDILNLETWLVEMDAQNTHIRSRVKKGDDTVDVTLDEMREIKFNLSSAKLDFADAMERIREGAWKEKERRERNRIWLAKYIRSREPTIEDQDVEALLKASELGAADGIEENDPTSYAGLWALRNPFTEVAELTNGMAFVRSSFPLDQKIVQASVPGDHKDKDRRHTGDYKKSNIAWMTQPRWNPRPAPVRNETLEEKEGLEWAEEKDMEFGYARQKQKERAQRRKRMIIALLVVLVIALIILVVVSTLEVQEGLLDGAGSW